MKEIAALGDGLDRRDVGDGVEFRQGNAGEELAASQRVDYPDVFEFSQRGRHIDNEFSRSRRGS